MFPPAPKRRSGSAPRSRCAISSSPASATASPRARAIRIGRSALADEGFCFRSYLGMAYTQYYRPSRAGYKGGRACEAPDTPAGVAAPERAVVQFRLPSLAVQLPDPHRAGARRAVSAHRGDLSAAGLHRRHHRRRAVRLATRPRMPADQSRRQLPRHRQRATGRTARRARRREAPAARPQARPGAAVGRRQRHQFLRPGRRRDRRHRHRARAVPAQRRDRIGGGFPQRRWRATCRRDFANCAKR